MRVSLPRPRRRRRVHKGPLRALAPAGDPAGQRAGGGRICGGGAARQEHRGWGDRGGGKVGAHGRGGDNVGVAAADGFVAEGDGAVGGDGLGNDAEE